MVSISGVPLFFFGQCVSQDTIFELLQLSSLEVKIKSSLKEYHHSMPYLQR